MKTENKNKYYNDEDEINFEKLNNFNKFNFNYKNNIQSNNHVHNHTFHLNFYWEQEVLF